MAFAPDDIVATWTPPGAATLVFQCVRGALMEKCWPALRPFVEAACKRSGGRFTPKWVAERLGDRTDVLWALIERDTGRPRGLVTTHLGLYPTGLRVVEIIMAGGEAVGRDNARACMATLHAYRAAQDCHRIEWQGRRGLRRWLGLDANIVGAVCEVA